MNTKIMAPDSLYEHEIGHLKQNPTCYCSHVSFPALCNLFVKTSMNPVYVPDFVRLDDLLLVII